MEINEKIKYDTTVLLNRIKELVEKGIYSSYTALGEELAHKAGISPAQARRIFRGQYAPNEKVKEELLKMLKLNDQDISDIGWGTLKKATIRKHKKIQTKHSAASKVVSEFSKDYRFNADLFEKLREDKGLSKMDVCTILGVSSPATFYQWERGLTFPSEVNLNKLAALFSVDREEFLIPRKIEMPSGGTENIPKTAETEEMQNVMPGLFKEIGDEQNIHKIFEIINNNILTLAAEMSKCTKLQEDRFGKLNGELEEIKRSVEALTDAGAEKVQTIVATVKPKAIPKKKA